MYLSIMIVLTQKRASENKIPGYLRVAFVKMKKVHRHVCCIGKMFINKNGVGRFYILSILYSFVMGPGLIRKMEPLLTILCVYGAKLLSSLPHIGHFYFYTTFSSVLPAYGRYKSYRSVHAQALFKLYRENSWFYEKNIAQLFLKPLFQPMLGYKTPSLSFWQPCLELSYDKECRMAQFPIKLSKLMS